MFRKIEGEGVPRSLLLGSMYFWSWLIQLNRSYKYNGKIACTGISTLNGHISKPIFFLFWVSVGGSAMGKKENLLAHQK